MIPYIVKVFPENRPADAYPVAFPLNCPSCATPLVRELDEAAWRCPNIHCPAQIVQKLIHHVSKDAMDIDGLGASLVERFFNLGIIRNMADIYHLDYEQISKLEGLGSKSVDNLKSAIDKAKRNPIHRVLHGLCIHHLGKKISKLIAEHLSYLPDLKTGPLKTSNKSKMLGRWWVKISFSIFRIQKTTKSFWKWKNTVSKCFKPMKTGRDKCLPMLLYQVKPFSLQAA
ncbi:MAG: hypothetical protein IPO62_08945 [Saprospiraceae bacterium]|nr:hypothetical protein [Saprospiraceae bacterium]